MQFDNRTPWQLAVDVIDNAGRGDVREVGTVPANSVVDLAVVGESLGSMDGGECRRVHEGLIILLADNGTNTDGENVFVVSPSNHVTLRLSEVGDSRLQISVA